MKDAVEISKLLIFNKDDTILGDGCGFLNYVYFIVSGKCQMIEQIFLSHKIIGNKIIYRPGLQVYII